MPLQSEPKNALGLTAIILAPIAVSFGLMPITGGIAILLGLMATGFATAGLYRVRRGTATNGRVVTVAAVLGVVAMLLGIWGCSIVTSTLDDMERDFDRISREFEEDTAEIDRQLSELEDAK